MRDSNRGGVLAEQLLKNQRKILTVDELVSENQTQAARLHILLLADDSHSADVVKDHIAAISKLSCHKVTIVNPIRNRKAWRLKADQFDVVLVHYSISIINSYFLPPAVAAWVKKFHGPKIQIIQDEYRWIDRMTYQMSTLGVDAVFSSLVPENIQRVYHHDYLDGMRFVSSLPGYVPKRLHKVSPPSLVNRPFHLAYRGRSLPIWYGKFGQEKRQIGLHAQALAERFGLNVDCKVREEDRVYGKAWNELLMSARATVATEGGSTVFDFDESIEAGAIAYRHAHPHASDEEVWQAVVAPHEGNIVHKTLTPRVLEAVMCRTALVMYPGTLRGVLSPWEHYIPLERDSSNDEDVARFLKDNRRLEELIERTYQRVANDPALQFDVYVSAIDRMASELLAEKDSTARVERRGTAGTLALAAVRPASNLLEQRISAFENPHTYTAKVRNILNRRIYWPVKRSVLIMISLFRRAVQFIVLVFAAITSRQLSPPHLVNNQISTCQTSSASRRRILLLCDFNFRHRGPIRNHIAAFKAHSANNICLVDARSAARIGIAFEKFDAIVIHYSMVISKTYLPDQIAKKIREYDGYKILYIQDEYRWVNATVAAIADLGIDVIYTVINEEVIDTVYHHDAIRDVRRCPTLTGFVSEELTKLQVPDYEARPVDVGYRARRLPAWLGRFAQEKWWIGQRFKQDAGRYELVCDIEHEENKRIYGDQWITFVSNCKAVLGTESGASFIDFTGEVQTAVEAYEALYPDADFEEIESNFFEGRDGETIIRVISPRCFEAAALRTLMILYPGRYSGVLEPWRHYVPLERDHSNMDDVVAVLRDPVKAQGIIDRAYQEIALNPRYSYRAMVEDFDRDIAERVMRQVSTTSEEISCIERRVEFEYRMFRRPRMKLHFSLYLAVHWIISTLVPQQYQAITIARIRSLVRHLRAIR